MTDTAFRDALRTPSAIINQLVRRPTKTPTETIEVAKYLAIRFSDSLSETLPDSKTIDQKYDEAQEAWKTSHSFKNLSDRQLQDLPWIFFYPPGQRDNWLAASAEKLNDWFLNIAAENIPGRVLVRALRHLLHEMLVEWPNSVPTFALLRERLKKQCEVNPSRRIQKRYQNCLTYRLLEADGPEQFAKLWLAFEGPADQFLDDAGLAPPLDSSRFVEHATLCCAKAMAQQLSSYDSKSLKDGFDRLAAKKTLTLRQGNKRELRFPNQGAGIANAILTACINTSPKGEPRELLVQFFLECYGDPRLPTNVKWQGVNDECLDLMRRWLVGSTLRLFFNLLDVTAQDHHWKYRRTFWESFYNEELITNAWVVLGPDARQQASRGFPEEYGTFEGSSIQRDHSVLLMEIGDMVIAEWSHNGSCRIWATDHARKPEFYKKTYVANSLRPHDMPSFKSQWRKQPRRSTTGWPSQKSMRFVHYGSQYGTWQEDINYWIWHNTGIRIDRSTYMNVR